MDKNYIIKVFDKDENFKKTLSRNDVNGDVRFSSVLNSGFSSMSLKVQNKKETQSVTDGIISYTETLGIDHGDIIKVVDPNQNVVIETTYERIIDATYD